MSFELQKMLNNTSKTVAQPRQSNFELLRIIAMFLVLVVHADFWSLSGPTSLEFQTNPLNAFTRALIESASIVCVNVFVLISGWFGIKPSLKGFLNFVFQCLFFLVGIYVFMLISGQAHLSIKGLAGCLCLTSANWFIRAYVALYLLSPVLNTFVKNCLRRNYELLLISFFVFQTIYGWSGAAQFIEQGYSAFSFIGLYLLARYIRIYGNQLITKRGGDMFIYTLCDIKHNILLYVDKIVITVCRIFLCKSSCNSWSRRIIAVFQ